MTRRFTCYAWRGKPIHDIKAFCKAQKSDLLTIECTESFQVPKFSLKSKPEYYWWCEDCSQYHYKGGKPTVTKYEIDEYEIPEIFWGNQRFIDATGTERIIKRISYEEL